MGQLLNGVWTHDDQLTDNKGEFQRTVSAFQGKLPQKIKSLSDYIMIVSRACPWAHRVTLARELMGFHDIEVYYADPLLGEEGWNLPKSIQISYEMTWIHELYRFSSPLYSGRVTLPLLIERANKKILSNDSGEMLLFFVHHWQAFAQYSSTAKENFDQSEFNLVPQNRIKDILTWQAWITSKVSNGPYRACFAKEQFQYEKNIRDYFEALDLVEARLSEQPFFMGRELTICDLSLFASLSRRRVK